MTDTMQDFVAAAAAFMNDGINRMSDADKLTLKAHTDAGATIAVIARFPIGYYSICVTSKGGATVELIGGYIAANPASPTRN
jgi:hypothetical protein